MKKFIQILMVFLTSFWAMNAQLSINQADLLNTYQNIPGERVYLHQNATLLLVGERLYFSLYCLNVKTNKLSNFSKIAYVEMISQDGQLVFSQRVRLDAGRGQADFFLPTSVASGSYKLVTYTRWMKNFGQSTFFQSDVFVINPYQANAKVLRPPPAPMDSMVVNKPENTKTITQVDQRPKAEMPEYLSLADNRSKFKKREKATIRLNRVGGTSLNGYFSISIRKINAMRQPDRVRAKNFLQGSITKTKNVSSVKSQVFLPELRGEMITGRVIHKITGDPAAGKKVSLSIPGSDFVYDIANSNENGLFYFSLSDAGYGDTGIFQVLEADKENYKITIEEHHALEHELLTFPKFYIDQSMEELILDRSIHNQIENSYADTRPDVVVTNNGSVPFYRNPDETYDLDDYTRFSTIEETMVEIIDHVWIKKDKEGASFFQVRPNEGFPESGLRPLLIVDGIYVEHHEDFMEYNAKRVKRIHLSRGKYIMGSYTFQGLLVINTKTADYHRTYYKDYLKNVPLFQPSPKKNYFVQEYVPDSKITTDRIPDFRTQLLWIPNLKLSEVETTLDFYTSDVPGEYEICLEGLSSAGRPISDRTVITVD